MYRYFNNCVNWNYSDVHSDGGLCDMIDQAQEITRRTFLTHVDDADVASIEKGLGYCAHHTQGLTMSQDWAVSYHRSKLHRKRVYYFRQSAIEYVFTNHN